MTVVVSNFKSPKVQSLGSLAEQFSKLQWMLFQLSVYVRLFVFRLQSRNHPQFLTSKQKEKVLDAYVCRSIVGITLCKASFQLK